MSLTFPPYLPLQQSGHFNLVDVFPLSHWQCDPETV